MFESLLRDQLQGTGSRTLSRGQLKGLEMRLLCLPAFFVLRGKDGGVRSGDLGLYAFLSVSTEQATHSWSWPIRIKCTLWKERKKSSFLMCSFKMKITEIKPFLFHPCGHFYFVFLSSVYFIVCLFVVCFPVGKIGLSIKCSPSAMSLSTLSLHTWIRMHIEMEITGGVGPSNEPISGVQKRKEAPRTDFQGRPFSNI